MDNIKKPKVSAIIVAAGTSSRMKGVDKLLSRLGGVPSVLHSLKAFEKCELIDEIVIVTREENINELKKIVDYYKVQKIKNIVSGGATRQLSVFAGINEISGLTDYYCIHDGARPLVSQKIIKDAIEGAFINGAAAAAVKVKDTIKVVENNFAKETPDRNTLYAIQTPQVFAVELYNNAIKKALDNGKTYTDDCQLVEALGENVYMSKGEYFNIKLTTPEDMSVAEALLTTVRNDL